MRTRFCRLRKRAGHRGGFLALAGAIDVLVGAYLIIVGLPPAPNVLAIDEAVWGGIWIGTGVFMLTGVFTVRDRWQFTAASLLKGAWAGEFIRLALLASSGRDHDYLWLLSAAWLLIAVVLALVSSWPEGASLGPAFRLLPRL